MLQFGKPVSFLRQPGRRCQLVRTHCGGVILGSLNNNKIIDENDLLATMDQLANSVNNDPIMETGIGIENKIVEESLQPSKSKRIVGLDDDRRTEEVLRDLGLSRGGPNANLTITNTLSFFFFFGHFHKHSI